MSSSVETRYPFLDESVIEFCAGIDPDYKQLPKRSVGIWAEEQGIEHEKAGEPSLTALPKMLAGFKNSLEFFADETYSGSPSLASAELGEAFLDVLGERAGDRRRGFRDLPDHPLP